MLHLVRYGELFLKSDYVRSKFEERLIRNIRAGIPDAKITQKRGRIFVDCVHGEALAKIFGIVSYSPVATVVPELKEMAEAVVGMVGQGSFAMRINRPYKEYPLNSQQIAVELGSAVVKAKGNKVNLSQPEQEIFVEVFEDTAFIYTTVIPGPGGLPLGTGGRLLLLNDGKDAERAGWMLMKRGCELDVLGPVSKFLDEWSIGSEIEYIDGKVDERMADYPALVTGSKELPEEKLPYPVFQPLLGF